ncbi:Tripartite tricarboxylate transporter family receptor [Pigmentiphaga humi]|uniref:Tripartite tricarboxylate transporter family receptor n=1 Tax=Pigmentiphaga humi TaxID=2478468 RepID=A0A3P4AVU1_9BURK|nr:tripartite tricarboxylate transporter substrate binding protein [Pigmentiphaga humi]VCU68159.1 Tripartite tricarboxylate transporter family receptor [Pigmentiphaga humi]
MMRKLLPVLVLSALVPSVAAAADAFPSKPVTIVVSVPAGGTIDAIARMVAKDMGESLGRQFVVENRPGANGNIAADYVRRAPADGYTLLMLASSTLTLGPYVMQNVPFDPVKDFAPVAMTAGLNMVLLANPKVGVTDLKGLVAKMKANPDKLNYSSTGNGSFPHVAGALLNLDTGTHAAHVPYKGLAPSIQDLLAGQVDFTFDSGSAAHVKSGKLNALAVIGPKRSSALPEVPTFRELGLPEMEKVTGWHGVFAPAGTPADVIKRLNAEFNKSLKKPESIEKVQAMGFESVATSPEELGSALRTEYKNFGELIAKTKISID